MNIGNILLWVFGLSVLTGLLFGIFNLIGSSLYDLAAIRRKTNLKAHPYSKPNRYRPLLSIVIPVHNEASVIERCLKSLLGSTYRKFEIIVADDASTDDTAKIVKKFISQHPNRKIYLARRRINGGRGAAIDAGLKKAKGELVMALDADCTVDRLALKNAVRCFANPSTAAVAMNIRIKKANNVISLLQLFDYILSFRTKKFNTLTNSEHIIGGAGATYRREVLKRLGGFDHSMQTEDIEMSLRIARLLGSRDFHLAYASDVLIYTEPVPSYRSLFRQRYRWKFGSLQAAYAHRELIFTVDKRHSKLLGWLRLPFALWSEFMLLLEPLFVSYFIYFSFVRHSASLFIVACLTMTFLVLTAIWSDEHLRLKDRVMLSLFSPVMYLVFYALTCIQVIAILKCIINSDGILGKKDISGAYISPERIGSEAGA